MNNELRFQIDTPVEVALASAGVGVVEEERFGWRAGYTLDDGRTMYLPVPAGQKLDELDLAAGQRVVITKRQCKRGQRREIVYEFDPVPQSDIQVESLDAPGSILPGAGGACGSSLIEVPAGISQVEQPDSNMAVLDRRKPSEILDEKVSTINGKTELPSDTERLLAASIEKVEQEKNGSNGHAPVNGAPEVNGKPANGAAPKLPLTPAATLEAVKGMSMCRSLKIATACAFLAEQFADEIGYRGLKFGPREIEALACTIDISKNQRNGNGGRY